ncbi:unnamed protein product [Microthlaspi erraticum]|uniref:Uncharacterized protein n=1 Tax=Microthlaspi erraticum TaxID=1685480 RepID=A0A6D2IU56_9BRAS|nr:unnamed protein product [Microthlaspi erraticum]
MLAMLLFLVNSSWAYKGKRGLRIGVWKCGEKFMPVDKVCLVCDKPRKDRNLVGIKKGGTGFAEHDDNLEAKEYKHLGSGSDLGLVRPVKT